MNKEAEDCVSLEEINEYIKQNWNGLDSISKKKSYDPMDDPEFMKLFNGKFGIGSIPMNIKMLTEKDIIQTNKSRSKMSQFCLSKKEVMDAINTGEKVQQNDTILCNGSINVRLVKKDEKYLIIDLYKK